MNQPTWPAYKQMVRNLFKKHPSNEVMAHHATTGIAGESGELRAATTRKNAFEEVGDMRFYMVALEQRLGLKPGQGGGIGERSNLILISEVQESSYSTPTFATVMDHIHIISCELLDLTKKAWIYEDPTRLNTLNLWIQLELLRINLDFYITEVLGTTWAEVEFGNQMKLLGTAEQKGRYSSGEYSNEQALARADKGN